MITILIILSFIIISILIVLLFYLFFVLSNKIMSLFPLINRPFNVHFFANPLNGLVYGQSLQTCSGKTKDHSTISYHSSSAKKVKLSTINPLKIQSSHKLKQSSIDTSSQNRPLHLIDVSKLRKYNMEMTISDDNRVDSTLKLSSRIQRRSMDFVYPQVQIIPLHMINDYEDIAKYHFSLSFQTYFKPFFPNQFKNISKRLIQHLEKYIPKLKHYKILDNQLNKSKWPQNFWNINNINDFLEISQSYDKNSEYWIKYILILVYYYFVPHKAVRQNTLQNLQLLIRKMMKEKGLKQQPNQQFLFLTENGTIVNDFIDIPFTTTRLFFIKKQSPQILQQKFHQYQQMIQSYRIDCKNKGFVNRLKHHFRKQTVPDKYSQETINYERNVSSKEKQRKKYLQKANHLIQQKKQRGLKFHKVLDNQYSILKSRSQLYQLYGQEDRDSSFSTIEKGEWPFKFHINLHDKKRQSEIIIKFQKYKSQNNKKNPNIRQNEILIQSLLLNDEILQQMIRSPFHNRKIKRIFEIILNTTLTENWELKQTIDWSHFLEFCILSSKDIEKLIINPNCYQLVRNFVQKYMEISQDDYFRDELTAKLCSLVEGDDQNILLVEEVLWNWLTENNFVKMGSIQRQLLWTFSQRSKKFYLLMISLLFGTFKTTLLDLAYQLLV